MKKFLRGLVMLIVMAFMMFIAVVINRFVEQKKDIKFEEERVTRCEEVTATTDELKLEIEEISKLTVEEIATFIEENAYVEPSPEPSPEVAQATAGVEVGADSSVTGEDMLSADDMDKLVIYDPWSDVVTEEDTTDGNHAGYIADADGNPIEIMSSSENVDEENANGDNIDEANTDEKDGDENIDEANINGKDGDENIDEENIDGKDGDEENTDEVKGDESIDKENVDESAKDVEKDDDKNIDKKSDEDSSDKNDKDQSDEKNEDGKKSDDEKSDDESSKSDDSKSSDSERKGDWEAGSVEENVNRVAELGLEAVNALKNEGGISEMAASDNPDHTMDGQVEGTKLSLEERQEFRSSMEETKLWIQADEKVLEENTMDFSEIKIACLGDSITQGTNLIEEPDYEQSTYPARLEATLGAAQVYNFGIGGSSLGRYWDKAFCERYQEIPEDVDIILVMGGDNDGYCLEDYMVGNIDDCEYRTLYGDTNELFAGLKENYPNAQVIVMTEMPNLLHDVLRNERDFLLPQTVVVNCLKELAEKYEYPVIDNYNSNFFDSHDPDIVASYIPDSVHPNQEGYDIFAQHVAAEIIRIYEQKAEDAKNAEEEMVEEEDAEAIAGLEAEAESNEEGVAEEDKDAKDESEDATEDTSDDKESLDDSKLSEDGSDSSENNTKSSDDDSKLSEEENVVDDSNSLDDSKLSEDGEKDEESSESAEPEEFVNDIEITIISRDGTVIQGEAFHDGEESFKDDEEAENSHDESEEVSSDDEKTDAKNKAKTNDESVREEGNKSDTKNSEKLMQSLILKQSRKRTQNQKMLQKKMVEIRRKTQRWMIPRKMKPMRTMLLRLL